MPLEHRHILVAWAREQSAPGSSAFPTPDIWKPFSNDFGSARDVPETPSTC